VRADPHVARFAVLQDAAEALLDELAERYMVDRRESKESLGAADALVRLERLMPRTPAAAPLAIAFTETPGIALRLGRWWVETLPGCSCAVCDEDPAQLVELLRLQAVAPVQWAPWPPRPLKETSGPEELKETSGPEELKETSGPEEG
jgi:hypothetical protein